MKIKLLLLSLFAFSNFAKSQNSIYSFKLDSLAGGSTIDFSMFGGKKILVINLGSADSSFTQFEECKQLYQLYKDSLIIVAVPVRSATAEPAIGSQLLSLYSQNGPHKFYVSAKTAVAGNNPHPLFTWLTTASLNGVVSTTIRKPGYKFLIDKTGRLVGVFNPRIGPMNAIVRTAIEMSPNF